MHRLQHAFEHQPDVVVGPGARLARDAVESDSFVAKSSPLSHTSTGMVMIVSACSRSSTVVAGGRHVKSRHT